MTSAQTNLPVRENCFFFNAPDGDLCIDDLIDAVERTAGDDSVHVLQHMGGSRFLVCTRTAAQATKLMVAEGFVVSNVKVAVEAVGPPITFVNVFRYPAFLPDEPLINALAQFGKVKSVAFATATNRPNKLNGIRVVRMEMNKPVPNFTTVAGHRVMFEYRGMRRVCARCSEVGHMASACSTPYCKRCGTFGHDTEGCEAECQRCGGQHGTRECFRKRSYVAAARGLPTALTTAANKQDRASVLTPLVSRTDKPNLQVLRSAPPTRTPPSVPPVRETDTTNTSDSTHAESTSTSLPAGQPAKAGGADSPHTHRVSDGGSGTESSSPDSSRDSWVVVLSEPDDQETAKAKATNNREEQAPRRLDDESFPPLPSRHTRPNCSEDIPITSCGRYILPGDAAHDDSTTLTGLFHQLPIASSSGDAPPSSPANTLPPELEQRRHRSRSRRRTATGTEDRRKEKGGRAESAEHALRRSKPPETSSDSDATLARNQPKKSRKGSIGDGPPSAPADDTGERRK